MHSSAFGIGKTQPATPLVNCAHAFNKAFHKFRLTSGGSPGLVPALRVGKNLQTSLRMRKKYRPMGNGFDPKVPLNYFKDSVIFAADTYSPSAVYDVVTIAPDSASLNKLSLNLLADPSNSNDVEHGSEITKTINGLDGALYLDLLHERSQTATKLRSKKAEASGYKFVWALLQRIGPRHRLGAGVPWLDS